MELKCLAGTYTQYLFRRMVAALCRGDIEDALLSVSDDVEHVVNLDDARADGEGAIRGKQMLGARLELMCNLFSFEAVVTDHLSAQQNVVRARMKVKLAHCETGQWLWTNFRFVVFQNGGLITRIEQYHDTQYIAAFARMIGLSGRDGCQPRCIKPQFRIKPDPQMARRPNDTRPA